MIIMASCLRACLSRSGPLKKPSTSTVGGGCRCRGNCSDKASPHNNAQDCCLGLDVFNNLLDNDTVKGPVALKSIENDDAEDSFE
mmetsp:Transcript_37506/g.37850  ORF Transcript_37506/g.37850 Transcript_37506/m.37850 type:complete len:85 (-) Transcript_37506:61-315(-)